MGWICSFNGVFRMGLMEGVSLELRLDLCKGVSGRDIWGKQTPATESQCWGSEDYWGSGETGQNSRRWGQVNSWGHRSAVWEN